MFIEIDLKKYRIFIAIVLLGFASGLPLLLVGSTLQAWYTVEHASLAKIGWLSLIGLPYVLKFLWAPLLERPLFRMFPRRTSWLLPVQILLILSLLIMACLSPEKMPKLLALLGFCVAFLSASQDILINALQIEVVHSHELGKSAACYISGYRVAMLVSGGIALIIAQYWGFDASYRIMAGLVLSGILGTWLAREGHAVSLLGTSNSEHSYLEPFRQLCSRPHIFYIFIFIFIYKISYSFSLIMTPTFLIRAAHFNLAEIGIVTKGIGFTMVILGSFVGGIWIPKLKFYRSLLWFGSFEAMSNIGYGLLVYFPGSLPFLALVMGLENFFSGMENIALVAYIMSLSQKQYSATQFAFLSAIATSSRVLLGPLAAYLVAHLGWFKFYVVISIVFGLVMGYLRFIRFYGFSSEHLDHGNMQSAFDPNV